MSCIDIFHLLDGYLRPGGRLVVWTIPTHPGDTCTAKHRLAEFVGPPAFISAIVGQLPTDEGDAVIATGIFVPASVGRREVQP
jgi:hypothetical protein